MSVTIILLLGAHPASYLVSTLCSFPGDKAAVVCPGSQELINSKTLCNVY